MLIPNSIKVLSKALNLFFFLTQNYFWFFFVAHKEICSRVMRKDLSVACLAKCTSHSLDRLPFFLHLPFKLPPESKESIITIALFFSPRTAWTMSFDTAGISFKTLGPVISGAFATIGASNLKCTSPFNPGRASNTFTLSNLQPSFIGPDKCCTHSLN